MNGIGRGQNEGKKERVAIFTKETVGMTLLLFGAIVFFITATGTLVFGSIGLAIASFFVGLFGFFVYPLLVLLIYVSLTLVIGKKLLPVQWVLRPYLLLLAVFLIVHTATAEPYFSLGFGGYLSACFTAAGDGIAHGTGGGAVLGLIAYPVRYLLTAAGAYVLYALLTAAALFFALLLTPFRKLMPFTVKEHRRETPKRERRAERTVGEQSSSVTFEDLPDPAPAGAPRTNITSPYPNSVQSPYAGRAVPPKPWQPQPQQPQPVYPPRFDPDMDEAERSRRSREILFGGNPAQNYRNNLAYGRDSSLNRPSSATVTPPSNYRPQTLHRRPVEGAPSPYGSGAPMGGTMPAGSNTPLGGNTPFGGSTPAVPPINPSLSGTPSSYTGAFTHDAELSRPEMPKRVENVPREDVRPPERPAEPFVREEPTLPPTPAPIPKQEFLSDPAPKPGEPKEEPKRNFLSDPAERGAERTEPPAFGERTRDFFRDYGREEPSRDFGREEPSRDFGREEPSRDFGREEPTRDFGREEPIRDFGGEEPTRDFGREEPTRNFEREEPPCDTEEEFDFGIDRDRGMGNRETDRDIDRSMDRGRRSAADLFDDDDYDSEAGANDGGELPADPRFQGDPRLSDRDTRLPERETRLPERETRLPDSRAGEGLRSVEQRLTPEKPQRHIYKAYNRPPLDIFKQYDETPSVSPEELQNNEEIIVETLRNYRIESQIVNTKVGATVTRYDIDIPTNVTVNMVTKHSTDLAMRLKATRGVNMYANNAQGTVSIEVPNAKRGIVGMRGILESDAFNRTKPDSLTFAIGKDIEGKCVCGDINEMTHILIAGTTGSGKSVCIHSMLISLIYKYSPEELRLILIDPKKSEFTVYEDMPHLMINEIITDAQKAVTALNWAVKEMERRYTLFNEKTRSGRAVRKLDEYNANLTEDEERLPKIVIVVDELADLMSVAKKDIEERIQRLSQKARAAGIHLVLSTQRPSVNVVTGVIKSNLPTRIALSVNQEVDSRVIIDESGAEKLLGNGDMIFTIGGAGRTRVQGAFLSSQETFEVIQYIRQNNEAYFDKSVSDYVNKSGGGEKEGEDSEGNMEADEQCIRALRYVVDLGSASISLIQRKCSVGYSRAGRIMEWMELMGYVSPFDGKAKARQVLLTKEEFEAKYGDVD